MSFAVDVPVRFAHCDSAGIAYYPRLLELCDGVIEDWCATVLKIPRREMHLDLHIGLPTVELRSQFILPCRLGDVMRVELSVTSLGRTSIGLRAAAYCEGTLRFTIDYVQVLMALDTARPTPWPDEWRARIAPAESEVPV
jgi:4-hydroxybenzoyl-CoA thioesterase